MAMESVSEIIMAPNNGNTPLKFESIENYQNLQQQQQYSPYFSQRNYILVNSNEQKITNSTMNNGSQDHQLLYSEIQSNSLRPAHIISPSKQAPEGYICVGRVIESPTKKTSLSPTQKGLFILNEDSNMVMLEFPSTFNPRKTSNMPPKEKVNKWIQNVPFRIIHDDILILECYPAIPSSSSNSESSMDFADNQDILELQCRRITRYTTHMYTKEDEPVARIDESSDDDFYDSEGNLIQYDTNIAHMESTFDNFFSGKGNQPIEYIINSTL